jgi:hypothetical protein
MKITELIKHLEKLKKEHGDLPVYTNGPMGALEYNGGPKVSHKMILQGREHKPRLWESFHEPERKGEKVVKL